MAKSDKLLKKVLSGAADSNIPFSGLCTLLKRLGNINWRETMMPKYEIILYWSDDDQAFIAEVPELAGCAADGQTYQEAIANIEVVIGEWIETAQELGRDIPQPKGRLLFA